MVVQSLTCDTFCSKIHLLTVIRILQLFNEFLFKLRSSALEEHKRIASIGAIQKRLACLTVERQPGLLLRNLQVSNILVSEVISL